MEALSEEDTQTRRDSRQLRLPVRQDSRIAEPQLGKSRFLMIGLLHTHIYRYRR